ncbi:hypothetical protein KFK09_023202 [Dendrobium nobile]|uniref:F-box protein n=1 Tax=Dendrobium nobile TaxID=94219 RepID=A0A8T3ALI3_DENNO|nr:hypothetical protein KFK09_023202 [Dendrobium nobile]
MTNTNMTIAANGGAVTTTIEEIHSDILLQTLCHLDGQSLASASCATSQLHFVSSHPDLWRHLCLSTWPSLHHARILPLVNSSPRRFFSDAFPFPASTSLVDDNDIPDELISAVDLYHRGIPIFSCVVETDTSSAWFRASPFLIDAQLEGSDISPEDLTLSWIVIDPSKGRAVNLSSRRVMEVRKRPWCVGETVARFTTVMGGWAVGPVVMWWKGSGDVMEVGLTVEDMDGVCVSGMEGLRLVKAAMEAERKGKKGEEEAKEMYLEYLKMKRTREERRNKRERWGDMTFIVVVATIFLSFVYMFIFR